MRLGTGCGRESETRNSVSHLDLGVGYPVAGSELVSGPAGHHLAGCGAHSTHCTGHTAYTIQHPASHVGA